MTLHHFPPRTEIADISAYLNEHGDAIVDGFADDDVLDRLALYQCRSSRTPAPQFAKAATSPTALDGSARKTGQGRNPDSRPLEQLLVGRVRPKWESIPPRRHSHQGCRRHP
jgi:hypothetical protein